MKVSQLTYVMSKDSHITVFNDGGIIYSGKVSGTKKDDPVNKMYVTRVFSQMNGICVCAIEPRSYNRGGRK